MNPVLFTTGPNEIPVIRKLPATRFISALTHEIRNPLTNINLSIDMLELAGIDDGLKIYLDIIKRSSARINELVSELFKQQQLNDEPAGSHSIHQLIDEVLAASADRIALKHIEVRKDYALHDSSLLLIRPRMKIALTNIVINAIEAMLPIGGVLHLLTKSSPGKLTLEISDNGCGISQENLKNIFKPYYTNKQDGLGLGLAATYDILQTNLVNVRVESVLGTGTKFILVFGKKHPRSLFNSNEKKHYPLRRHLVTVN